MRHFLSNPDAALLSACLSGKPVKVPVLVYY